MAYTVSTDQVNGLYAGVVRDLASECIVRKTSYCHPTRDIAYRAAKKLRNVVLADAEFEALGYMNVSEE